MGTTAEELQYSEPPTRICGQDELYAVDVVAGADGKKRMGVDEQPLTVAVDGVLAVGTSAVEAKVGSSRLSGRRSVSFTPTNGNIWYGFSPSLTTANGRRVFTNQVVDLPFGDSPVYLIAQASVSVQIWEAK